MAKKAAPRKAAPASKAGVASKAGASKAGTAAPPKPTFFKSGAEFGAWLDEHGETAPELFLGFYKTKSAKKGITYKEAIEEALCAGWVDGIVRTLDADSFMLRFSPRQPKSIWSAVNIARALELQRLGRMKPAGLAAFAKRDEKKARAYSYENRPKQLDAASEKQLKASPKAWEFFVAQRPSYQRTIAFWIMDAVKPETRAKRLQTLIADCEAGRWIKGFISPAPKQPKPRS